MSLTFDDLLAHDDLLVHDEGLLPDMPEMPDMPDVDAALVPERKYTVSPMSRHSTHSHSHRAQEANGAVRRSLSAPQVPTQVRRSPLPSLSIQIDPDLLAPLAPQLELDPALQDSHYQETQRQPEKLGILLPSLASSPSDWLAHTPPFPYSRKSTSPKESPLDGLAKSWHIDTSGSASEVASGTSSPLTPAGPSDHGEPAEVEGADKEKKKSVPPPKKKSHARKQPEGHIKRARNAFILFRKHVTDSGLIPPSVEVKHQNISVVAAKMWREAPQEVRQKFQEQARIEKEEHQRMRVRKDAAEDEKVEAVAEALIKGKAGDALEKEIKDQMVQGTNEVEEEQRGSRRDQGQLSKGAIRAQRAQARARQMRQNLLGSNLLSMSMYNAQQQQRMAYVEPYFDPLHGHAPPYAHAQYGYDEGYNYHLAPLANYDGAYDGTYYPPEFYGMEYAPEAMDYHLPPISLGEALDSPDGADEQGEDPRMQGWIGGGQQTPSGHVVFNERLFEGLASAGLNERRDDALGSFEEAVAQANDMHGW